jgi:Peptidase family M28
MRVVNDYAYMGKAMFDLLKPDGSWLLPASVALAALVLLLVIVIRSASRTRTQSVPESELDTTPISSVHAGKKDTHRFKFDPAVARKRGFMKPPKISLANLPPQDKRVAKRLGLVTVTDIEKALKELTGEVDVTVGGTTLKIKSRSTYGTGVNDAIKLLEEFYAGLGVSTTKVSYKWRGKTYQNLVAEFKGTVRPEKVLVVGSHIDSTAGDTFAAEKVAPGADDDGSGTVALMELAKALAAMLKDGAVIGDTIRLVHFTGEEQGLWGSYTYSDKLYNGGTQVTYMVQIDMIGYCAKKGNRLDLHDEADRNGSHSLVELFVRNIARYRLDLNGVDTHDHAVRDRSDHAGFADHGWKFVMLSEEFTEGENGGFNPNYHSTGDRVSKLNLPYMLEVIKLIIATVPDLANVK